MNIDQLNQGVTGRVIHDFRRVIRVFFQFFPDRLGGGKAVVAIAHGIEHDFVILNIIALLKPILVRQRFKRVTDLSQQLRLRDFPPLNMSTLLHQLKIVNRLKLRVEQGLNNRLVRIIDQHHDVWQLQCCIFTDPDTGRQTIDDRAFSCPDHCFRTRSIVISLKVKCDHQAFTRWHMAGLAVNQNKPLVLRLKDTLGEILLHGGINLCNTLIAILILQVDFRENKPQRRGLISDQLINSFPVFRFRGVLVTGDNGPMLQIDICFGQ